MNELSCVTLRKVDPSKNMARQYSVAVCRDLFGTPVVVCRWGRIGRAGRSSQHVCGSVEEAEALAGELVGKRQRRGYGSEGDVCARQVLTKDAAEGSAASTVMAPAMAPRQRRARKEAPGQLWLFDGSERTPAPKRRVRAENTTSIEIPADEFSLMRRLGKPATRADRERAMSILTLAASLRGIELKRGTAYLSGVR